MEASELFEICRELAQSQPSAEATRQLHEVLLLTCAEGCRQQGGAFGNLFSQVDFLGKKLGLDTELCISLQTARRHTNTGAPISSEDWPYDVMAVARLVSAVFKEDVPGQLLSLLPIQERPRQKGLHINKEYIRCIVSRVEDEYILADTDDGEILIDYRNTEGGRDHGYLQKLLREGMQLNLLDCHVEGQSIIPGLVVVEPDFLIDISSLTACFTNYGHHPLLYTLSRLKERPNTQATLLGNFAGTALDDIINRGDEATLAASLQRSFREQALRFCACPDFDAKKFKLQAEEQMRNIREAVALLSLPPKFFVKPGSEAERGSILLEPSFICERLGLQGRVDMMTSDMTLLVEQKSGRNPKIAHQSHDAHGLQLENHYVQLLLYYGVLRYNFGKTDRQVDMRLLYSRYPAAQGLLTVNYYRGLLREALKLRNQIVATELYIARDGFQRILPLLREDVIYKDVNRDEHFHHYVLPEINALATHHSQLTPLERAYYNRMLTFVYREQQAARLGSTESQLHHPEGWAARAGDLVYLYQYQGEPDIHRSILFKGSLMEINPQTVTIELKDAQQHLATDPSRPTRIILHREDKDDDPTRILLSGGYAIEPADSDVGTSANIRSVHRLITAAPHRRALLLGQRAPEADTSICLTHSYHPDYDDVLLAIRQARDYYLLLGPPGTGKTSMALKFIVEEELQLPALHREGSGEGLLHHREGPGEGLLHHTEEPRSILLMAYTNRAVDEICAMLSQIDGLDYLRIGSEASCDERFRHRLLDTALADTQKMDDARQLLDRTPVIVATTSMLQAQPWVLRLKHFSLAVVDEASQILEPAIIGILADDAIDRFVLVGDHKQLPAVVVQNPDQSLVTEPELLAIGLEDCRQSLFERLLRWEHRQHRTQFTGILHTHGRMHPDVARFPLAHFYQREQLRPVPLPHQREEALAYPLPARDQLDELLKTKRMLFMKSEQEEAMVADLLARIYRFTQDQFDPLKTVGVIVTYRRQIAQIRQAIATHHPLLATHLATVSIDTVERYQGSQRDVIIYSVGVEHRYQLDFLTATTFTDEDGHPIDRKLNVALTRARRQMIVVGRQDLLSQIPIFRQLIHEK